MHHKSHHQTDDRQTPYPRQNGSMLCLSCVHINRIIAQSALIKYIARILTLLGIFLIVHTTPFLIIPNTSQPIFIQMLRMHTVIVQIFDFDCPNVITKTSKHQQNQNRHKKPTHHYQVGNARHSKEMQCPF